MSQTQFAFIKKINIPNKNQLQASLDALNFDLKLDPEYMPFEDEGFSPCILNGETDIGFEIYYEPSSDLIDEEDDEEFTQLVGTDDYLISMVWSSSFKDCQSVLMVSIALAKDFGATISYEGKGIETIEGMLASIQECKAEIAKES